MDGDPRVRRSYIAPLVVVLVMILPILYVLSVGPVVAVVEATGVGEETSKIVYWPVIWLHNNTPLKEPLEWYGELWGWQ